MTVCFNTDIILLHNYTSVCFTNCPIFCIGCIGDDRLLTVTCPSKGQEITI